MAAVAGPVAKRSPQDTVEAREAKRRITEATEKYGRGKAVQLKKIRDKKLRGNLRTVEDRYKTAALRAKDAEILLENESGFLEPEAELERTYKVRQDEIKENVSTNQLLLEEYIRFKGALIELGKVGNAFTAELSNEELAFKENGQKIAYISNQSLVITNAEIRNKLSLGNESRGWFDFIPRTNGNLSIKWRGPV